MENKSLNYYIADFFKNYLTNVIGVSNNTIFSYRDTFVLLFNYLKSKYNKNVNLVKIDNINRETIVEFLIYLENQRNNSIRTRNQRLAAIHSFYKYLQIKELSYCNICADILSIPIKKALTNTISYFSKEEFEYLINSIDTSKKDGFRDYILFMLFYELGARVSEITNMKRNQLNINEEYSSVIINGKGNKQRINPISKELSKSILKYIDIFNIGEDNYVFQSKFKNKITTKGISYLLNKYIQISKRSHPDLYKKQYCTHSIRHSRATHLLEDGVPLEYIKDILGHEYLETTYIYAEMSPKLKEIQISKYSKGIDAIDKYSNDEKNELLDWLKTL